MGYVLTTPFLALIIDGFRPLGLWAGPIEES